MNVTHNISAKLPIVSELREWLTSERDLADRKASLCRRCLTLIDQSDAGEGAAVDLGELEAEIDELQALGVAQESILETLLPAGQPSKTGAAHRSSDSHRRGNPAKEDDGSSLDI